MRLAAAISTVLVTVGVGSSGAALRHPSNATLPRDAPGVPFVTFAHATAKGDYGLACEQFSAITLMADIMPRPRNLAAARKVCARALGSSAKDLAAGRRRSLASTHVVNVRVKAGRARVTVQTTLYGVEPRTTGTATLEGGRWKIAVPASGAHVGRSLVEDIPSSGMRPTLNVGDTILVDRDAYLHARPQIGDIVVLHPPAGAAQSRCGKRPPAGQACATATPGKSAEKYVKRIVARAGDRVSIIHGHVIRNGTRVREDFASRCYPGDECDFPRPFTVAPGGYYVLGDNRGASDDSRFWGPATARAIIGRVRRLGP